MEMRFVQVCFTLAMLTAPIAVSARTVQITMPADSGSSDRTAVKPAAFSQATSLQQRYNLGTPAPVLAKTHKADRRAPISDHSLAVQGALYGDGEIEYIEGPSISYQRSRKGPTFEAGALGGGMETAPFLAHGGMNWQF